jgi:hypothetical protein
MKYLATVVVTERWTLEVTAKDEDAACDKLAIAFEKITRPQIDHQKVGKFEIEEDLVYEIEEL